MDQGQVLHELSELITYGKQKVLPTKWGIDGSIEPTRVNNSIYFGWYYKALSFIKIILPMDSEFIKKFSDLRKNSYTNATIAVSILESIVDYYNKGFLNIAIDSSIDADAELKTIFSRFHRVARQLRNRYDNRPTLDVKDEYDVQNLLHALLRLFFDDIRNEEWTPSYAGKSARMDFLLKNEKKVIEVKNTRKGLTDKELGDQLIIDVDRYKSHPDCDKLICFVYDPEGRIGNPEGLMTDLNKRHQGFVEVIIEPIS